MPEGEIMSTQAQTAGHKLDAPPRTLIPGGHLQADIAPRKRNQVGVHILTGALMENTLSIAASLIIVIESMPLREHAFMQNAGNQNACRFAPEEDDVLAHLHAVKARANVIARAPGHGIVGEAPAKLLQFIDVKDGLSFAPCAQRIHADA